VPITSARGKVHHVPPKLAVYTAQQVGEMVGLKQGMILVYAKRLGLGQKIGPKTFVFTDHDVEQLKSQRKRTGRPLITRKDDPLPHSAYFFSTGETGRVIVMPADGSKIYVAERPDLRVEDKIVNPLNRAEMRRVYRYAKQHNIRLHDSRHVWPAR
jgi:hypothetical protein